MTTVLLTGGRAPATLDLARLLWRSGVRVVMAESVPVYISRPSRAIAAHYRVPAPRFQPRAFTAALHAIARQEDVDWLIPTCEEAFYVAHGRAHLQTACRVLVSPIQQMARRHHKGTFTAVAAKHGPAVPRTETVTDRAGLAAAVKHLTARNPAGVVLKPAYSRFGDQVVIRPTGPAAWAHIHPSEQRPWVVQAFVSGPQICTYSVAHNGRLTAHTAYRTPYTAGPGAAVAFKHIDHASARRWVAAFAAAEQVTGQLAFDFIEDPATGAVTALECNPRLTSGVHLFVDGRTHSGVGAAFVDGLLGRTSARVEPPVGRGAVVPFGMGLYAWAGRGRVAWRPWARVLRRYRHVVWADDDWRPWVWQAAALRPFLWWAWRRGISRLAATTYDIEWNGESV